MNFFIIVNSMSATIGFAAHNDGIEFRGAMARADADVLPHRSMAMGIAYFAPQDVGGGRGPVASQPAARRIRSGLQAR